jgi:hypothetical protein
LEENMLELTCEEREYLVTILRSAHTELLHDLHHADSRDYRRRLRDMLGMNEHITEDVISAVPVPVGANERNLRSVEP